MKKIILIVLISGFLGFLLVLPVNYALDKTSDSDFCVSCHEMTPMVLAYKSDVHGGNNAKGVKARCVDCHIPHDNLAKYVLTKAKNGIVEGYIHFTKNVDEINWHEKRKNRGNFVYDNGCMSCHSKILNNTLSSFKAQQMHEHYVKLKDTKEALACANCHIEVGHNELNNILNYYKPKYEIYNKKAAIKKEELEKDLRND